MKENYINDSFVKKSNSLTSTLTQDFKKKSGKAVYKYPQLSFHFIIYLKFKTKLTPVPKTNENLKGLC